MKYYLLKPEVAGEIGNNSNLVYEDGKIKEVPFLEYRFIGWLGDELLTTHPCFIVTKELKKDIVNANLKGMVFGDVSITFSDEFHEAFDIVCLPEFVRIICNKSYENNINNLKDDFYTNKYHELIVSEKALRVIKCHQINNCTINQI